MAAIVEDDEGADHETAGQDCERHCEPPGYRDRQVHQIPEANVWDDGIEDLPDGTPRRRSLIFGDDIFPKVTVGSLIMIGRRCALFHQDDI